MFHACGVAGFATQSCHRVLSMLKGFLGTGDGKSGGGREQDAFGGDQQITGDECFAIREYCGVVVLIRAYMDRRSRKASRCSRRSMLRSKTRIAPANCRSYHPGPEIHPLCFRLGSSVCSKRCNSSVPGKGIPCSMHRVSPQWILTFASGCQVLPDCPTRLWKAAAAGHRQRRDAADQVRHGDDARGHRDRAGAAAGRGALCRAPHRRQVFATVHQTLAARPQVPDLQSHREGAARVLWRWFTSSCSRAPDVAREY